MAKKAKSLKGQWKEFQQWIGARSFIWQNQEYLILHAGSCSDVIRALVEQGFLEPVGKLHQIVEQMGLSKKERKEHPIIGKFNGQVSVFKVIKPLHSYKPYKARVREKGERNDTRNNSIRYWNNC